MGISFLEEFFERGKIGKELLLGWRKLVGVECVDPIAEGCEVMGIGEDCFKLLGLGSLGKEVEGSFAVRKGVSLINGCRFVDDGGSFFRRRLGRRSGGLLGGLG